MPTVLHTEASRGLGGQEIRTLAEIGWLLAHGWGALVACQPESPLLAEARAAGVPAVPVPMRSALDLRALAALRRLMRAGAVSLVHTHSSVDSWLGALAARSLGLPVVRSRHVSIPIRRSRALVYRLADRVITSGEAVRAIVVGAGIAPARVVSVPPGVDTARFHPGVSGRTVREELGIPAGAPAVGLVANIRGSKGHNVFLEAAREILGHSPDARFLIVGDGVGFAEIRQRVRDMGLEPAVTMTGFRRDIPEIMAALDVLEEPGLGLALIRRLWAHTRFFKAGLAGLGFNTGLSESPITPVIVGEGALAMKLSDSLFAKGVFAQGIAFPTVARDKARVRTIVTATHTRDELQFALDVFAAVGRDLGII